MILSLMAGCSDQNFAEIKVDAIAVVNGDFDNVAQPLFGLDVGSSPFNGFIDHATWDTSDEPPGRDSPGESVEDLFTVVDDKGDKILSKHGGVFVNSGTRGLNRVIYNYTLEPDDAILTDSAAIDNVCGYVQSGGTLVVSDWAYDLVETCFPDAIEWVGDDAEIDAAQLGRAGEVVGVVYDTTLAGYTGESIALDFNYTAWAVMESVGSEVEVLIDGDVEYQPSASEGYTLLESSPLMVRWLQGTGQVVVTSFHFIAQADGLAQSLLIGGIPGLQTGTATEEAE